MFVVQRECLLYARPEMIFESFQRDNIDSSTMALACSLNVIGAAKEGRMDAAWLPEIINDINVNYNLHSFTRLYPTVGFPKSFIGPTTSMGI